MPVKSESKHIKIGGMTCINCQNKIEKKLQNTLGVEKASVSYENGSCDVTYNPEAINLNKVYSVIAALGYEPLKKAAGPGFYYALESISSIVLLYLFLGKTGILNSLAPSQLADPSMGYSMLFVVGLVTSIHCIAMCGGINLSQALNTKDSKTPFLPSAMYNFGRVISYTLVGLILGFIGAFFGVGSGDGMPVFLQGTVKIAAGAFMAIMGVNMLGIFPGLRKLQIKVPKALQKLAGEKRETQKSPFIIGLLNGLMPCGPLQSMQIVALASGSPIKGALSMLMFSLGTTPLMLGFGSIASALGQKFTKGAMKAGAVLVVALGLSMLSQGGSLSGLFTPEMLELAVISLAIAGLAYQAPFKTDPLKSVLSITSISLAAILFASTGAIGPKHTMAQSPDSEITIEEGFQLVTSTLMPGGYPNITVKAGLPVKWVINAPEGSINGCNNKMIIKEYGIEHTFTQGSNLIEFKPEKPGNVGYSCWMGMIRGNISITE